MYPKIKYSPHGGTITVTDAAHERALGPLWLDNERPPEPAPAPEPPKKKR